MAGQFMSLLDVRTAAIYRADLEGITDRHPTLDLNREANLSYRELRVRLANAGVWTVLSSTAILALPVVEAVAGGGYAEIPWPTNAVSVHGLDAKVAGNWSRVAQGDFTQRRLGMIGSERGDYSFADQGQAMWVVRSLPTTTTSTQVAGAIMLFPVPVSGQYVLWFLPEWVDISNDTDLFPGQEVWLQWVVWDLAVKALIRDVGPQVSAQLQLCQAERERVWSEIRGSVQVLANDGPIQPTARYGSFRGRGARLIT
jgi:hypothetical protein